MICGQKFAWSMSVIAMMFMALILDVSAVADEQNPIRAVKLDPDKLAGLDLPSYEQFIAAEDVIEGNHRPRGEVFYYGEQLIVEIYEDDAATFRVDEPFLYDEFVTVLNGKLMLIGSDGESQEFVAGESLVVPKGFTGKWKMLGTYRELIVIERQAYEEAFGAPED